MKLNNNIKYLIYFVGLLILVSLLLGIKLKLIESFRIVFGSFFVLFLPGYVMSFIFFKELEIIERIALSFALSIAVVPLAMFYLNLIGIRINFTNSVIVISCIILTSLIILYIGGIKSKTKA